MNEPAETKERTDFILRLIVAAVLIWGFMLAIGAYQFNWDLRKPFIILGCVIAFLGGWGLLLRALRTTAKITRRKAAQKEAARVTNLVRSTILSASRTYGDAGSTPWPGIQSTGGRGVHSRSPSH